MGLRDEGSDQRRNVLASFRQRRHVEGEPSNRIEQVGAESSVADRLIKRLRRAGHDPHIGCGATGRGGKQVVLAHQRQQSRLLHGRQFLDIVQQEHSAACSRERLRERRGTRFVAGELAAIDHHEGLAGTRACGVYRPRQRLLAGPAGTADQDRIVAVRRSPRLAQQFFHDQARRDNARTPACFRAGRYIHLGRDRHRLGDLRQQFAAIEGFGEEAEHSALGRGHGIRNGAVRGENDDRHGGCLGMQVGEQGMTVHAVHAQIGYDRTRPLGAKQLQRLGARCGAADRVAAGRQSHFDQVEQARIVVDHQDSCAVAGGGRGHGVFFRL